MKDQILSGMLLSALLFGTANADCVYPRAPSGTPDGMTATQEEMLAGMEAVKQYNAQVTEYLECLDKELAARVEAAGPDAPAEQIAQLKSIHSKRHNAAVDELEAHAARFNEQVKAYKAREDKG